MTDNTESNEVSDETETSRRRFLKAAGKIAVYTPPAMLLMSKPSFATFTNSGGYTHQPHHFSFQNVWRSYRSRSYSSRSHGSRKRR